MNIFAVHQCPIQSARELPDVHVNKMLQECVQLLSTAHAVLDGHTESCAPTHTNHPCAIFVRENSKSYMWVLEHAKALMEEYTYRTGKIHQYQTKYMDWVLELPKNICNTGEPEFRMCMPDEFKLAAFFDVNLAYRLYLKDKYKVWATRTDKRPMIAKWTKRKTPEWAQ